MLSALRDLSSPDIALLSFMAVTKETSVRTLRHVFPFTWLIQDLPLYNHFIHQLTPHTHTNLMSLVCISGVPGTCHLAAVQAGPRTIRLDLHQQSEGLIFFPALEVCLLCPPVHPKLRFQLQRTFPSFPFDIQVPLGLLPLSSYEQLLIR